MSITQFSQSTIASIGSYVYMLVDPRDNKIFYVGEGQGNRVFDHVNDALNGLVSTEKLDTIREIDAAGMQVKHYIVRHGLDSQKKISCKEVAFEIESTLIDLLSYSAFKQIGMLSNIAAGHHTFDRGIKTVDEIEALYNCLPIMNFNHKVISININKTYKVAPSIYDATRSSWKISDRKINDIEFVLSEYQGIVRAIYKPIKWTKLENGRYEFEGVEVTDPEIINAYLNRSLPAKKKGDVNPIHYFGW